MNYKRDPFLTTFSEQQQQQKNSQSAVGCTFFFMATTPWLHTILEPG